LKRKGRYETSHLIEDQYEPGSGKRVLKNRRGIKRKREIDKAEAQEQFRALDEMTRIYDRNHRFTPSDICHMHEIWLGPIYEWAGSYRQVNISKGGFHFAAANHIPKLMTEFGNGPLREFTPCRFDSESEIARVIAIVHTEFVLIHPFREGNGRLARLFAILMGLQAGLPPLDFGGIRGKMKQRYFAAVQAGMDKDSESMKGIFESVIRRTLKRA